MLTGWLEIGKIVAAQGLKGELRVYPDSDFPERFEQPGPRWLLKPGAVEPEPIELLHGRYLEGKGLYVLQLAGVTSREEAEALRGSQLVVPESDRPPLEEGEFHVLDLIGLAVFDQATQQLIGTVVDIIPAGNDLLEVKLHPVVTETDSLVSEENIVPSAGTKKNSKKPSEPTTVLIPFVEAIVPVVDLQQGRLEITPPPGLIE